MARTEALKCPYFSLIGAALSVIWFKLPAPIAYIKIIAIFSRCFKLFLLFIILTLPPEIDNNKNEKKMFI